MFHKFWVILDKFWTNFRTFLIRLETFWTFLSHMSSPVDAFKSFPAGFELFWFSFLTLGSVFWVLVQSEVDLMKLCSAAVCLFYSPGRACAGGDGPVVLSSSNLCIWSSCEREVGPRREEGALGSRTTGGSAVSRGALGFLTGSGWS